MNTVAWAKSKSQILKDLDNNITQIENRMATSSQKIAQKMLDMDISQMDEDSKRLLKLYEHDAKLLSNLKTQQSEIKTEFSKYSSGFKGYTPTFGSGSFDTGKTNSSGGSDSNKDSSSTEKEIADMEKLSDRYLDVNNALELLDNELERNKSLRENATSKDQIKYLEEELKIIQKQEQAYKNKRNRMNTEINELKKSLTAGGFNFWSDGQIKESDLRLDSLTNWANSLTGDNKETAQANVKAIYEDLKRYNELLITEIPKVDSELLGLKNTAIDVNEEIKDLKKQIQEEYKNKLETVADVEGKISDLIKKNAEERIEKEKEALEKSIENDRKRIESKKKALNEELELYNKQYSEDNYEAELNEEKNRLLQLQSEIDKLQFANDNKSKARLESLIAEYSEQQKLINDKIAEHQNQAINDRFEQEQELLDKELEDKENSYNEAIENLDKKLENFLTPQNLTNLVNSAMKSGFVDILGETVNLNNAMKDMYLDTEVGIANINIQYNEWLDKLGSIKSEIGSINSLMTNAGLSENIKVNANSRASSQPISIDMGGITIEGNVNEDTLKDLDKMFKKQQEDILSIVTKKLSGK